MIVLMFVKKLLMVLLKELKNLEKLNFQKNLNYLIMPYTTNLHVIN